MTRKAAAGWHYPLQSAPPYLEGGQAGPAVAAEHPDRAIGAAAGDEGAAGAERDAEHGAAVALQSFAVLRGRGGGWGWWWSGS